MFVQEPMVLLGPKLLLCDMQRECTACVSSSCIMQLVAKHVGATAPKKCVKCVSWMTKKSKLALPHKPGAQVSGGNWA